MRHVSGFLTGVGMQGDLQTQKSKVAALGEK